MTYDEIRDDIAYLSEDMANLKKQIPRISKVWKICFVIPVVGLLMNLISIGVVYTNSQHYRNNGLSGFLSFIGGDAIYVVISCLLIGCVMALMSFNYVLAYSVFSAEAKAKSILLHKVKSLSYKLLVAFSLISISSVVATFLNPLFSLGVPVIMFVFIIASSVIINTELTRIGIAPMFNKLIKITKNTECSN